MKQLQIISPSSYCPKRNRPFDKNDLILQAVALEDTLNHPFTPITIPKMKYLKTTKLTDASRYAFFRQFLP